MEYFSVKAAAQKWGVTPRWVQKMCESGKIAGAERLEGSDVWMVPKTASPGKKMPGKAVESYQPQPVDTSGVQLPPELGELTEQIAENVHENWAASRIAQGWIYGEKRDGEKKTTPCLVPYDRLTEEEKDYDRKTAMETLRLITYLGYKIEKA